MKAVIIYMPVIHQGYINFLLKHEDSEIYLLGEDAVEKFSRREIRALESGMMAVLLRNLFKGVINLPLEKINRINFSSLYDEIIMPDEKITHDIADNFLSDCAEKIVFENVFLRWDEKSVLTQKPVNFDSRLNPKAVDEFRNMIFKEAEKSFDWWRQVGAVIVKDGKIIMKAHNYHLPTDQTPYTDGDPRDFIEAGKFSDLTTAAHCERALIAQAAREGVSLLETDLYITTFPCPSCAISVALSGIKRCIFFSGHASLNGERNLKEARVELIYAGE